MEEVAGQIGLLAECYDTFAGQYLDTGRFQNIQDVFSNLFSSNKKHPGQDQLLLDFHAAVEALVASIAGALPQGTPDGGALVWKALEIMLFYPRQKGRDLEFALISAEPLAQPLLELLDRPGLEEALSRYKKLNPSWGMLPNQQSLRKAMEARLNAL